MGTINYGNQILTFDYFNPATSQSFNKLNYKLREPGIYSGGTLGKVDSNTISISPLTCYILDTTVDIGVRVETTETIYVTVAEATPYVALRMDWENKVSNYMDVVVVAYGDLQSEDLILGKCIYRSGVLQNTFDTTRRDNSILDRTVDRRDYLKVYPTNPESNKVYVDQGTAFVDNTIVEFSGGNSPALTDTTLGRIDYITLDGEGNILVEEGNDAADPDPPNYPGDAIVLAQVERGASRTDVIGTDITQFIFDKVSATGGGTTTSTYVAAENIAANEVAALNASGQAIVASKNDEDKVNVIGIATEAVTSGNEGVFQKIGLLENFTGLTPGSPCYLGNSGAIIQDESSIDESEFRVFIGIAKTATILDVSVEESSLNALRKGTICTYTTGENISANEVVAVDSSGNVIVASKDDNTKIEVVGIAIETITSGNEIQVQKTGILDGFTGLTAGDPCYLGNTGVIIQDKSSIGIGEYSVYLGIAKSTTSIDINIGEAQYIPSVIYFTAGENLVAGNAVYLKNSDTKVYKADNDDFDTAKVIGFAIDSVSADESVRVQFAGIENNQSGLTANEIYYLGESGAITTLGNIGIDEVRIMVGTAISATELFISIGTPDYIRATDANNIGDIIWSANPSMGRLQGVLPFGSNAVSQSDFAELYAVVGDSFETAWTDLGYAASGAGNFYGSPPIGFFGRAAIPRTEISTSEVDTTNDRIDDPNFDTFAFHIQKDGTPIILSTDDTAPGGITAGTIYYARLVNTNQSIEFYDTELNAIDTSGTTGRVTITSTGTGPHYISNAGVRLNTAMWPHKHLLASDTYPTGSHRTGGIGQSAGWDLVTNQQNGVWQTAVGSNRYYEDDETNTGTPNLSNETRPDTILLYGYIKASHVGVTGEPVTAVRYSTGWVSNSDWTDAEFMVNHNLGADLSDLIVKFFISTDGTEANAFEIMQTTRIDIDSTSSNSTEGYTSFAIDNNSFKIQTGKDGIIYVVDSGAFVRLDTESYYYKVVVYKPSVLASYTGSRNTIISISDATDQTVKIPSAASIDYPIFIKRVGTGDGKVLLSFESGEDETGVAQLEGDGGYIELISDGSDWYIKDYYDYGSETAGDWEKFGNGTMKQIGEHTEAGVDIIGASSIGGYFGGVANVVTFPKEFASVPKVIMGQARGALAQVDSFANITTTTFNGRFRTWDSVTDQEVYFTWHAIGRWK